MSTENESYGPIDATPDSEVQKKRGGCLAVYLVFVIAVNTITALSYLFAGNLFRATMPDVPGWAYYVLALFGIINAACGVAVWQWKRIGVYGFIASAVMVVGVNVLIGIGLFESLFGLIGPVILYALVRPVWKHFD